MVKKSSNLHDIIYRPFSIRSRDSLILIIPQEDERELMAVSYIYFNVLSYLLEVYIKV